MPSIFLSLSMQREVVFVLWGNSLGSMYKCSTGLHFFLPYPLFGGVGVVPVGGGEQEISSCLGLPIVL
jgi:hypothetical protein